MTDKTLLDTAIKEPSLTASELEMLLFALERSRAQFAWKAGGLDADALRKPFPPSTMTLGGLVKHLALIEDYYTFYHLIDGPMPTPWRGANLQDPTWAFTSAADHTPDEVYEIWRDAVARSRDAMAKVFAERSLDDPSNYKLDNGESPNLRRFLVDLHDEYARHVGHADLMREAIDGLVGEDPPQPGDERAP